MKYKIKITYDTGNSFRKEEGKIDFLDLEFTDLEIAKDNLRRIKEHYLAYMLIKNEWDIREKDRKREIIKAESQDWYVSGRNGEWEYIINLFNNKGETVQEQVFWAGYFESLVCAEIVSDDEGMKIEF